MFETINRKLEIDAYNTNGRVLQDIRGDIELRDVYFSYPARKDEQIFHGFCLSVPSGATAALVGQSGSGKSTLKWIRQKIGLVSQEPVLFTGSIKGNIAYGKDSATTEEIRAAAELANAAKFIDLLLPQGMDTVVDQHGTQLSAGQKQRVAIARAILKNSRILLLDEATSALDAESERVVQEALDKIMVNRTTVIVAHRLSTVRNADTIAVIHRGVIVEQGNGFVIIVRFYQLNAYCSQPHSELTKDPDGAYHQLIRLQENITVSKHSGLDVQDSILPFVREESSLRRNSIPSASGMLETAPVEPNIPATVLSKGQPKFSLG
ncbi:putative xenobiotic-transporting ATPase [Rosa chinensis]|uniref:Putative xenobiotic-transporting ATPase n=1 Tax=Rosa chinensis TaxID=74649 RepID=A0A2P6QZR2_ROSCH|nr:putative xenobiotic-transporting ATPase [Rosa chinensis]